MREYMAFFIAVFVMLSSAAVVGLIFKAKAFTDKKWFRDWGCEFCGYEKKVKNAIEFCTGCGNDTKAYMRVMHYTYKPRILSPKTWFWVVKEEKGEELFNK